MAQFTITLVENDAGTAAKIISAIGQHLSEYRLSMLKTTDDLLTIRESSDIYLLNLSQIASSATQAITYLTQTHPNAVLLALVSPDDDHSEMLLTALNEGIADYASLSPTGLLSLGRRLAAIQQQQQTVTTSEETSNMYSVATTVIQSADLYQAAQQTVQQLLHSLQMPQGQILWFNEEKTEFKRSLITTLTTSEQPLRGQVVQDDPIYAHLEQTRRPTTLFNGDFQGSYNEATLDFTLPLPPELTHWVDRQAKSALLFPLQVRNKLLGVLVLEATAEVRTFGAPETLLISMMASQIGLLLDNITLNEREELRRQQTETLQQAASTISSSLNPLEVLKIALDQLRQIIDYDSTTILFVEEGQWRVVASRNLPNPNRILGKSYEVDTRQTDPISQVLKSGKPLILSNAVEAFQKFKPFQAQEIASWLGSPLIAREQTLGLISVHQKEAYAYKKSDVTFFSAYAQQVAIALDNARLHQQSVNHIEHELTIAQEIQETLLPQVVPQIPGLQISGRILPARQVGGDFFHFFPVSGGNQLGVAVGDVSGKGIPAALYMAVAITAIDIQVRREPAPGELMNLLNQSLYTRLKENKMNIGLQVATFEPLVAAEGDPNDVDQEARGVLMTAASGGMIAPIGATERGCRFLPVSGLPIGALPAPDQTYEDDMFLLDPFTTIIFTSDGIVEAQNELGEMFGFDRLEATINEIAYVRDAETIADYILDTTSAFIGNSEQHDDMTVVVVVKT